jgi:enoyl-CoA hydratase
VLALMCDWRIAVDDPAIRIGLNETQLGIGLPPIVVESLRIAVPPASLAPIALEGNLFGPADALGLGLVHELAPADDLLDRATAKARTFAARPAAAVAQVKHALRAPSLDLITRTADHEANRWLDTWFSPEAQSRLRATVAKLGGADRAPGPGPRAPEPVPHNRSVSQPLPRLGAHSRRDLK